MARLYRLPHGEDLNARNVREAFPRNPDNEAFVRQLIGCGWHVNAALSRDHRYDGLDMHVENDVRAHIVDGRLLRFWGVVRDRSSHKLKEQQLRSEASQALDLLGAVPDPILVVNRDGRIEGGNPAVEWSLGWSLDELLGNRLEQVLTFEAGTRALIAEARPGRQASFRRGTATCSNGTRRMFEASIAAIGAREAPDRVVMSLRLLPIGPALRAAVAEGVAR
jgi:PAS domain S-box-containing protein